MWTPDLYGKEIASSLLCLQFPGAAVVSPSAVNSPHHFGGYASLGLPPSLLTASGHGPSQDQFPVAKPRMRICFDPETEIPKLQKWFAENNHPTRQQVEEYVRELNSQESRRGRRPLDVNNVIYWFKTREPLLNEPKWRYFFQKRSFKKNLFKKKFSKGKGGLWRLPANFEFSIATSLK